MTEEQARTRRDQLVARVNELVDQIPALQREEQAIRGQIQLLSEQLGEAPAPPGAIEVGDGEPPGEDITPKKPNGKPKRRGKAVARG